MFLLQDMVSLNHLVMGEALLSPLAWGPGVEDGGSN